MKKIAFVCDFWNNAGTETAAINWLNLLSTEYEVTLFLLEDKINVIEKLSPEIKIKSNIVYSNYYMRVLFLTHWKIANFKLVQRIRKIVWNMIFKDGDYDAIINFPDSSATFFKYLNFESTKLLAWNHFNYGENVVFAHGDLNSLREKYFNGYKGSDYVISVSKAASQEFNNFFSSYNNEFNVEYIYTPQNVDLIIEKSLEFIPNEFQHVSGRKKVLCLARIDENQKGQLRLLNVISKLNVSVHDVDYYFIGDATENELNKFNNLVEKLELKNVFYLGKKTNPYPYIKGCDLFILPSLFEGYGLVLQEALILNKPSICTDMTSKEILDNESYGNVCSNTEQGIYEGLLNVLSNTNEFTLLGRKASGYRWSNEKLLEKFTEIIKG